MAESGQNERASFGRLARNQTKYGTNTKATIRPTSETYLKHFVKPGDTLQGIALRYSSTTEQIKRANNIWTNDSLFLREYLLVPISHSQLREDPHVVWNGSDMPGLRSPIHEQEVVTKQDLQNAGKMSRSSSRDTAFSNESDLAYKAEPSAQDYLSKFDSSLAQIRSSVQRLEKTSKDIEDGGHFPEDEDNPLSMLPSRRSSRHRSKSRSFEVTFGSDDLTTDPQLMFKSNPRSGRQLRNSLTRLEKAADDMFQL